MKTLIVLLVLLLPALASTAQPVTTTTPSGTTVTATSSPPDEMTAAIVAYPLTVAKIEAYAAVVKEVGAAQKKDAALRKAIRSKHADGKGLAATVAEVDSLAPLKKILDRHGLSALDFVLLPTVIFSVRAAVFAESSGHPMPADRKNAGAIALLAAEGARLNPVIEALTANLQGLGAK